VSIAGSRRLPMAIDLRVGLSRIKPEPAYRRVDPQSRDRISAFFAS
jgi:hypothetical protein